MSRLRDYFHILKNMIAIDLRALGVILANNKAIPCLIYINASSEGLLFHNIFGQERRASTGRCHHVCGYGSKNM